MNPWRGLGDLPRAIWLLATAVVINRAGMMALPFLVLYLTRKLGYAPNEAGFVLTCYGLGSLATAPFSGRLSDKIGALRLMKWSLFLTGVVLFLFPLIEGYALIVGATLVWAAVSEAFRPASLSFIAEIVTPENRKAAYALNRLAINLGMSIGPAVGGFLFLLPYPALWWADGATAIAAAAMLRFARWDFAKGSPLHTGSEEQKHYFSAFKDGRFVYYLIALLPVLIVFFLHESAMPLFFDGDLHLPSTAFGMVFTINTAIIILIEVPLNLALAHRPHREMLALGCLLTGIGFGAMAFSTSFLQIAFTVVIWTFGEMILFPTSSTYLSEVAPPARRGEYMGVFQMTFSLAFALSAWLGTSALERFGAMNLWMHAFAACVVSVAMMWRIRR